MPSTPSTKNCPQCQALLAADEHACVCGYRFETSEPGVPSNLLAQAEELYETHLRARLQRANRAVKLAKVDLLRDPGNPALRVQLREAEKEAKALEAQVATQVARVADARAVTEREHAEQPANVIPIATPQPANTEPAPETFRAAQATKAEKSLELINLELATEQRRANEATAVFKAMQAEKARAAENGIANVASRTCPNCALPVAAGVARCDCGHHLYGTEAGFDFLSADELAALRSS